MYKKYHLMNYLPTRYQASEEQVEDRNICYNFKNGIFDENLKKQFLEKIKQIIGQDKELWTVCFIPASSKAKTKQRFDPLASVIKKEGYCVASDAIYNKSDKLPEHIMGKTENPTEFFGINKEKVTQKKILLIDDIITRGVTFEEIGKALEGMGATTVVGLFLAQTINPDFTEQGDYIPMDDDDPFYYHEEDYYFSYEDYYYNDATYDRYNGSYAQDVEGWSDQMIDDALGGEPDAYCNID